MIPAHRDIPSIPVSLQHKLVVALDEAQRSAPEKVKGFLQAFGGDEQLLESLREARATRPLYLQILRSVETLLAELQVAWEEGLMEGVGEAVRNVISPVSMAAVDTLGVPVSIRTLCNEALAVLAGDLSEHTLVTQDEHTHRHVCRVLLRLSAAIEHDEAEGVRSLEVISLDESEQFEDGERGWPLPLPELTVPVIGSDVLANLDPIAANAFVDDVERIGGARIDVRLDMLMTAASPYRVIGEIHKCIETLQRDARKCGSQAVVDVAQWLIERFIELESLHVDSWKRGDLRAAIVHVIDYIRASARALEDMRNGAVSVATPEAVEGLADALDREAVSAHMAAQGVEHLIDEGEPVVWIGGVCVPQWLYDTAMPELAGLSEDLRDATERLHSLQLGVTEWMRIPHTIGGIAANLRLERLREAAEALELWAAIEGSRTMESGFVVPNAEVDRLVAWVHAAITTVEAKCSPGDASALIEALDLAEPPIKIASEAVLGDAPTEMNSEIFAIFADEAQDLAAKIESALRAGGVKSLKGYLHTLKSAARIAGFSEFGRTAHDMETRLGQTNVIQPEHVIAIRALLSSLDGLLRHNDVESLGTETLFVRVPRNDLTDLLVRVGETNNAILSAAALLPAMLQDVAGLRRCVSDLSDMARDMTMIGETSIHSGGFDAGNGHLHGGLSDPLEFDRFTRLQEIARRVSERLDDVLSHRTSIEARAGGIREALDSGRRTNETMRDRLMTLRAVPFASLSDRFRRVVDLASRESGKLSYFDLEEDAPIDAAMQRDIVPLIEHLIRNAVIHGIERAEDRGMLGKPSVGRVAMRVERRDNAVAITIQDDGRGVSVETVRRKAGLPDMASEKEVFDVLFRSGFSTAENVTQEAGRGVGLGAVREGIERIGGSVELSSEPNKGMSVTLKLPSESDYMSVMVIGVAGEKVALPARNIVGIHAVSFADAHQGIDRGEIALPDGRSLPVALLGHTLRLERRQDITRILGPSNRMLELEVGDRHALYVVDGEIQQTRNVQYRALAHLSATLPGILGLATIEGGRIAPIIHPILFSAGGRAVADTRQRVRTPTVLVVDDSITVRKATVRSIGRHGFKMVEARDGVEALEIIERDGPPSVILLDIEMPRMDGFTFAEILRSRPWDAATVPVIMISSRMVEKYRDQAASLGINQCMGKPFSETDLLAAIKELTREAADH